MEEINYTPEQVNFLDGILDEMLALYHLYFGKEPNLTDIKVDTSDDGNLWFPVTYRGTKEIILWSPDFNPYRFYYQLSHELCHWMIPRDVPDKLRWLEEVIAVMAPPFFASKVKSLDHFALTRYLNEAFKDAVPVDFPSLFVPGSETITALENNREKYTDYSHYETISLKLLPAVQQHPAFWKAVPLLCDVEPAPDLKTSFDRWLSLVDDLDVHSALSKVIGSLL